MKRILALLVSLSLMAVLSSCGKMEGGTGADDQDTGSVSMEADLKTETDAKTEMSGMENTENTAGQEEESEMEERTEVNTAEWKKATPFTGAMWIPHDEMAKRYDEIPKGRPVLLHCGGGIVSVPAYETLIEKRPDIPELSYIDGTPPIKEYNEWLESQK